MERIQFARKFLWTHFDPEKHRFWNAYKDPEHALRSMVAEQTAEEMFEDTDRSDLADMLLGGISPIDEEDLIEFFNEPDAETDDESRFPTQDSLEENLRRIMRLED